MKEGKAPALRDWVGGMAAPGGPQVPQVEEGQKSWLPSPQGHIPKSGRARGVEPGLACLSPADGGARRLCLWAPRAPTLETFPSDWKIRRL